MPTMIKRLSEKKNREKGTEIVTVSDLIRVITNDTVEYTEDDAIFIILTIGNKCLNTDKFKINGQDLMMFLLNLGRKVVFKHPDYIKIKEFVEAEGDYDFDFEASDYNAIDDMEEQEAKKKEEEEKSAESKDNIEVEKAECKECKECKEKIE